MAKKSVKKTAARATKKTTKKTMKPTVKTYATVGFDVDDVKGVYRVNGKRISTAKAAGRLNEVTNALCERVYLTGMDVLAELLGQKGAETDAVYGTGDATKNDASVPAEAPTKVIEVGMGWPLYMVLRHYNEFRGMNLTMEQVEKLTEDQEDGLFEVMNEAAWEFFDSLLEDLPEEE